MPEASDETRRAPRQPRDSTTFLMIIAGTFGLQALTLVTGIIIARVLGVEGRGLVALVFALGLFASQLTFGSSLPIAVAKGLAERRVTARDGLRDIARRRVLLLLPPSLAAGAIMLFLQRSDSGTDPWVLAGSAALMSLQTMVFRLVAGGLQGEGRLVRMAWVGLLPQGLFAVVLTTAAVADWGWQAVDMLLAYFVTSFIGIGFAFTSLLRPTRRPDDRLDEHVLWAETRRSYVSSVRPLDGLQLDRILVGGVAGTLALGLYAAASAVSNLCSLVSNAVAVVVLPRVAMHHDDPAAQQAVIRRWVIASSALITAVVVALELVVDPVIRLAFGPEFDGAIACARWLILADGLMAFRKVLIAVLQGQGRGGTASWVELAILPLMVVGIVVAAQHDSLVPVALSLVASGLVACVALGWAIAFRSPRAPVVEGTVSR